MGENGGGWHDGGTGRGIVNAESVGRAKEVSN